MTTPYRAPCPPDSASTRRWQEKSVAVFCAIIAVGLVIAFLSRRMAFGRAARENAAHAAREYVRETTGITPSGVACRSYENTIVCFARTPKLLIELWCDGDPEPHNDGCAPP